MFGRVVPHVGRRVGGIRGAPAAPALVEQDDPVAGRIEEAPGARAGPRTGTTVDDQRRLALGVAAHFPVDVVVVAHVEQARLVRLDRWKHLDTMPSPEELASCTYPLERACVMHVPAPACLRDARRATRTGRRVAWLSAVSLPEALA